MSARLSPEGGGFGGVPQRLEKRTSVSEDAGPKGGWIWGFHIDWRRE